VAGVVAVGLVVLSSAACQTYNQKTNAAFSDFEQGRFKAAMTTYGEGEVVDSPFLAGAEAGTAGLAAGDWDAALEYFGLASNAIAAFEAEALLSATNTGELLMSWVLNEGMKEYRGEGYERVMMHSSYALAFLAVGAVEDALVEVRLANQILEHEEELYEKEYGAGGLGHFISAVGYELVGRPDDAYIDYERMEAKGLGGELVGRSLVRLARALSRTDEAERWEARFGVDIERPENAARIIVIAGIGMGPEKREGTLVLPLEDGIFQLSIPVYESKPQPVPGVELEVVGEGPPIRSVVIENVAEVARKNLADRIAWLTAKSAVRGVMKLQLTKRLEKDHGGWGALAGILFTFVSERADLRSWRTLPDTWQACRLFLPPGSHELVLRAVGGDSVALGTFELAPGETQFIFARTLGHRLHAHVVGGGPAPSPAPEPPVAAALPRD